MTHKVRRYSRARRFEFVGFYPHKRLYAEAQPVGCFAIVLGFHVYVQRITQMHLGRVQYISTSDWRAGCVS